MKINKHILYIILFSALILYWMAVRLYFYIKFDTVGFDPIAVPISLIICICIQIGRFKGWLGGQKGSDAKDKD